VRVAISGKNFGNNWANIFHCQFTTSSSIAQSDLDSWLNTFQAQYKTSFAARMNANATYAQSSATLYTPGGGVLQSNVAMTGTGSHGGTAVTDATMCKVISWLSTVYWRGGKPRTYVPGIETGDLAASSASVLANAEITAMTTAATGFRTAVNAMTQGTITGTTLGFVSFQSGNVVRPTPLFFAYTGAKVHSRAGTQRRRMGKWTV